MELYASMVKCRMIGERARALASAGYLPVLPPTAFGREATFAGVTIHLKRGDALHAPHFGLLAGYLRGTPLERIFAALAKHRAQPRASAGAAPDVLSQAIRAARKLKTGKNDRIAVVFCAEGDATPALWKKHLATATRLNLPIVFVTRQAQSLAQPKNGRPQARVEGVPVIEVDADDAVAVYRVATESIGRARQRRGPTVIEAVTLAPGQGFQHAGDSVALMESYLNARGLFDAETRTALEHSFTRDLNAATYTLTA